MIMKRLYSPTKKVQPLSTNNLYIVFIYIIYTVYIYILIVMVHIMPFVESAFFKMSLRGVPFLFTDFLGIFSLS